VARLEEWRDFDDAVLEPTGNGHDLGHPALAIPIAREVDDDVDTGRHRRNDERVGIVSAKT
jgi:hypothetical protein